MTWPTEPVSTSNLDSATDSPAAARADLLDLAQKFNQLIAHVSNFMRNLLTAVDAGAARSALGLGSMATQSASSVNITGGSIDVPTLKMNGVNVATTSDTGALASQIASLGSSRKPTVLDHGTKSSNYTLDLSLAELHLVAFSANATLTISSALTNDRAIVVVKSNGNTITLSGVHNDPPTLTAVANRQDFIGLVKSFGRITAVASALSKPTA